MHITLLLETEIFCWQSKITAAAGKGFELFLLEFTVISTQNQEFPKAFKVVFYCIPEGAKVLGAVLVSDHEAVGSPVSRWQSQADSCPIKITVSASTPRSSDCDWTIKSIILFEHRKFKRLIMVQ